ncbi:MAG: S8 family serine peptidase [Deltaproteobacteria bacterium]|nr:S8 family serine peptidase [Deltaproteobacteria bacterium]
MPPAAVRLLADDPAVEAVKFDARIAGPSIQASGFVEKEWNLRTIYAHFLWDLGYTGQNVVLGSLDTGVDLQHPLLQGQWRGGENSWFDPNGEHDAPSDRSGHGTQIMGLMVAGETPDGTAIGVAPGAMWIAAKIFNDAGVAPLSSIHAAFQWVLDPDGQSETDDAPDVVVNSWEFAAANKCVDEFQNDIDTLRTAGIALVFIAGNFGPNAATSASPGNNGNTFSVGSVDFFSEVSDFSSRGPSACDGRIFPDVTAPGESVDTTDLSLGGFPNIVTVDGTSMAAPHAAGAMALLLSAFREASIPHLENALRVTAFHPLCAAPDNDYGYGILNVLGAYLRLIHTVGCPDDLNRDGIVEEADIQLLAREFGESDCAGVGGCAGDMNFDNRLDGIDLSEFALRYGEIACPVYPLPYDLPQGDSARDGCTPLPDDL